MGTYVKTQIELWYAINRFSNLDTVIYKVVHNKIQDIWCSNPQSSREGYYEENISICFSLGNPKGNQLKYQQLYLEKSKKFIKVINFQVRIDKP